MSNVYKPKYLHDVKDLSSQVTGTHYTLGATSMACQHERAKEQIPEYMK